jgi:class 3 adenylate cyclase/tetratricopeptide (TPR) repeat protein
VAPCAVCGVENPDGARFCNGCGGPLTSSEPDRRRPATALFCDLSDSTAIGERADVEAVFSLMRSYFHAGRDALTRHGGSVEKFVGDAIVGVFGVPEAHEDDALRACRAALEIQDRVAELNADLEAAFGARIAVRIGINTGEVVAGELGTRAMFASSDVVVLGDAVNVAARLEQAAAPGEILIGESTYRLVRDSTRVHALDALELKGKSAPVAAYRLLEVAAAGAPPRRLAGVFAGREAEVAALESEFEAVRRGRCSRIITVVGEPGIGKSRLAAEVLGRIGDAATVARGACLSYGEGITYWAIGQIVRELAAIHDGQSLETARRRLDDLLADQREAAEIAAALAQLLGLGGGSTTPEEIAWAVRQFLATAASSRPLVVVVDDIQWAEQALLDLLASISEALRDVPVLVLCLARPELRERDGSSWPITVSLEPLGETAVDAILAGLGAPAAVRQKLVPAASGNPLFAEELVAALVDEGLLGREANELGDDLHRVELPGSINALLAARLDRLETGSRDTLERGAVEGEVFHQGAVVELSETPERARVPERLDALVHDDFVRPAPANLSGELAFRFKHLLVREAAYGATAKKLRAELHERFAMWLEQRAGDRVAEYEEILGYHLEQSYRYLTELGSSEAETSRIAERAAGHLAAAARHAETLGDFEAVATLLERALSLGFVEPHERLRLQVELGGALGVTRRQREADEILTGACLDAERLGEPGLAARARVRRGWNSTGDPLITAAQRAADCEEAMEIFVELGDDRGLADARRLHALSLSQMGRTGEALAELQLALRHAKACGDQTAFREVVNTLTGHYCMGPTRVEDAIAACEHLLEPAHGDRLLEATVSRSLGVLYAMAARPDDARAALAASGAVLDEVRLRRIEVFRYLSAYGKLLYGDREGAERDLLLMWNYFRDIQGGRFDTRAGVAASLLASIYCDTGRLQEASDLHEYGRGQFPPGDHLYWLTVEMRLAAADGRLDEAVGLADETIADVELRTHDKPITVGLALEAAAEVERAAGRPNEAAAALSGALEQYERKGNVAAAASVRRLL